MIRPFVVSAALCAGILLLAPTVAAQDAAYPARSIRMYVPYGAGGASDVMARKLAQRLGEKLGQSIVIENQPAAAGTVAYTMASRATPDGYTLIYGTSSIAVNAVLKAVPPYDPIRDFQPVSKVLDVQNVLVVPKTLGVTNVQELIALAKSKPGDLNYVSLGAGSTPHLSAELFRFAADIELQQVPYKQTTQAYMDLIEGRVQLWVASLPSALPHIQSGKLVALAVAGKMRSAAVPDVPTLIESGVQAETTFWQGVFAPAGLSGDITKKLNGAIAEIVAEPDTRNWYLKLGAELSASTPGDLEAAVRTEMVKWNRIADDIGLSRN